MKTEKMLFNVKEFNFKKFIIISLFILFFLFIIIYSFLKLEKIIFGIKIKNVNIVDNAKITVNPLEITGNAENAIFISLNGREITVDKFGNFTEKVAILPGYNIINLEARDKFGNKNIKNFRLIGEFAN